MEPLRPPALAVEVVLADASHQRVVRLEVPSGTTLGGAIERASILEAASDMTGLKVGIHGRLAGLDTVLSAGDRVEIYRPLLADPKAARRRRARR